MAGLNRAHPTGQDCRGDEDLEELELLSFGGQIGDAGGRCWSPCRVGRGSVRLLRLCWKRATRGYHTVRQKTAAAAQIVDTVL